jgi:hypothetical protein
MSAPGGERRVLGDAVVRVYDRGPEPEWHRDRSLFGPWWRFEAELVGEPSACESGSSPWDAVYRLVANRRSAVAEQLPEPGSGRS